MLEGEEGVNTKYDKSLNWLWQWRNYDCRKNRYTNNMANKCTR